MARTKHNGHGKKIHGNSKYDPSYCKIAEEAMLDGMTYEQCAKLLGISTVGLYRWMSRHEEFRSAIKKAWYNSTTERVEKALAKTALGYDYQEIHTEFIEIDGERYIETSEKVKTGVSTKGNPIYKSVKKFIKGIKTKIVNKHVPSHHMALFFWLQNRDNENWKNVSSQAVEGKVTHEHVHRYDYDKLSRDEVSEMRDKLRRAKREQEEEKTG